MTARLVVLISGTGSNAADLLTRLTDPDNAVDAAVVAMGSDLDAPGLRFATERDIPTFVVPLERGAQRQEWGERLIAAIDAHSPDLVILSGFMRLLPANVVAHYSPICGTPTLLTFLSSPELTPWQTRWRRVSPRPAHR